MLTSKTVKYWSKELNNVHKITNEHTPMINRTIHKNRKSNNFQMLLTALILFCFSYSYTSAQSSRYAEHSLLSKGKWVKIRVKDAGVYSLSKNQLASMGFMNPAQVCLYGYNLPVLPEACIEQISDDLTEIPLYRRDDNSLLFYSCGTTQWSRKSQTSIEFDHFNNPYSKYVYYFVTERTDSVPAAFAVKSEKTSTAAITSFDDYALIENDEFSFINAGRTFYERYDYANGRSKTYKISLPGIEGSTARLCVKFAGAGSSTSKMSITANDTTFAPYSIAALQEYEYGIDITRTYNFNCAKEQNSITLNHERQSGVSGHLDYIAIFYKHKLDLTSSSFLPFRTSRPKGQAYKFQISGAREDTRVWAVTSPSSTYEIESSLEGNVLTAYAPSEKTVQEYVAVNTTASFPSPEIVGTIGNQDLHALKDIDFVIIVPANGKLTAQAQRLADAHTEKDTLRCAVVRADQIYNEFSSGTPDITAYRRFMKMLYDRASSPANKPKNVCLFGDGVWDNKMQTDAMARHSADDYLLCYESDNSVSHTNSYVFEEYITLLADGKGVKPLKEAYDCGVGRITVTTEAQAKSVVDKLISYINNEQTGSWKNTICMMADDGNANVHMNDAEAITLQTQSLYPDYNIKKIYWDSYKREQSAVGNSYPATYNDINKQMEDGALIMNYTGHGAAYCLSHEQVLKRADFENWSSPRLPFWIHAACDVTPFDMDEENIGESALLNPTGGAVGVLSSTRTVYSSQNRALNTGFMKYVLADKPDQKHYTLGEALAKAKSEIATQAGISMRDSINKCHFVLLGDPAIYLTRPTYKAVIDSFEGGEDHDGQQMIGAGAVVSVKGHIEDEDGQPVKNFNGTVSPTVFDNLEKITCNNNAGEDITPKTYYDRTKVLYMGTDSVRNGEFQFTFPVPLDINYSDESGLLSIYAVNTSRTIEANGKYEDFLVGGTSDIGNDTTGPTIKLTLNGTEFESNGDSIIVSDIVMHETPFLHATLFDESGISTTGSGIGHDICLIIDNDADMTYNLNSYFNNTEGSWKQGTVDFSIPALSSGSHTLLFRAWDNFNNPSSITINFEVCEGLEPQIFSMRIKSPARGELLLDIENDRPQSVLNVEVDVFDMAGRKVWHGGEKGISASNFYTYKCNLNASNGHMPPGIYICKAYVSTANGDKASKSIKFVVAQ